ncbi:DegT/DnrJ/EryC1/StrS family aminotransferase [Gimesia aquarii]|uniref:UDP-4-amino-4-deoxy-L-arabinose--oxoglutarate aminotransferase n=1 Tax=Gimesia aquarii TaxID=2527964 RepID=A0A517VU41_9PLAN|nr:DegT/DnrJ/EryC1/StrS family aminotransferase [Gimesia aquarii]QDT96528.1 UDP-4-amino-4-deoxy-L-arabinose--oxoglutarate aminotransferase [Gimesia aquarii]
MIYQSCFQQSKQSGLFETLNYSNLELGPEADSALENFCPELLAPEFRIQLAQYATFLYWWRTSPEDHHDWIGFASKNDLEYLEHHLPDETEIKMLLVRNEILSGSKYCSDLGIAAQTEKSHHGVTSFILSMLSDLKKKLPGEYFELDIGFTTDSVIMKKTLFLQFMEWLNPFIQYCSRKMNSHEFLIRNPEQGIRIVLDRLFNIWYLENNLSIYDMLSKTTYIGGKYKTKSVSSHVSLGCVNYKREADENLVEASRTGRIASGRFVEELEDKFCEKLHVKHAIAVCNGTLADAIALSAIAAKTNRKNVITPALTFIAQANAIIHAGLNPVFVDVGKDGLLDDIPNMAGENDSIVYPTHLMGKVCSSVKEFNKKYPVLEDACEALGSQVDGKFAGTLGMAGTFSMYVSHSFTSGEGGMIITNDDEIAEICRSIRNHGRMGDHVNERFRFPRLGFNGKMSNIQAAFATAHFDDFEQIVNMRKEVVSKLTTRLGDDFGVASHDVVAHAFPIKYSDKESRDRALVAISNNGIECRPLFSCIASEHFSTSGEFPNAEEISSCFLYVPCHHLMTQQDIDLVCTAVSKSRSS